MENSHRSIIAKEGWSYICVFLVLTLVLALTPYKHFLILPLLLAIFTAYFFRNPERTIPDESGSILAPADGKVISINEVWEDEYIKSQCIQISIFLSLFNVHINRVPMAGKVEYISRSGNTHLPAYRNDAAVSNVSNTVGIKSVYGKIMVVQITGMIARRIVCWFQIGDTVKAGDRLGLIKFGSCTQIYLPTYAQITIKPGDKVRGGETVIGKFND
ncbi:MAG: phosphatidylserine decarboxylase family protein [Syntrophomonadaceae bacterium]